MEKFCGSRAVFEWANFSQNFRLNLFNTAQVLISPVGTEKNAEHEAAMTWLHVIINTDIAYEVGERMNGMENERRPSRGHNLCTYKLFPMDTSA